MSTATCMMSTISTRMARGIRWESCIRIRTGTRCWCIRIRITRMCIIGTAIEPGEGAAKS